MKGTALLMAWQMLLIMLPLLRELVPMLAIPTAILLLLLLLSNPPAGPQLLLSNSPARETAVIHPLTATSPAATLPKTANGKRMGFARRRGTFAFFNSFTLRLKYDVQMDCSTNARVMLDEEREECFSTS